MMNQWQAKFLAREMFRRSGMELTKRRKEQFLFLERLLYARVNAALARKMMGPARGDGTMTFNPVSYFAGIGTVFAAIAVGFGGGLLMTHSVHDSAPPNRVERVTAAAPLSPPPAVAQAPKMEVQPSVAPVVAATAAPAPVTTIPTAASEAVQSPSPSQASTSPSPTLPQQPAADVMRPANQLPAANQQAAANDQHPVIRETGAKPQDQDIEAKRIAERKQAERRKWAERKRRQQDLEGATVEVRRIERDDGAQEVVQKDAVGMPRIEIPRLGLFGED